MLTFLDVVLAVKIYSHNLTSWNMAQHTSIMVDTLYIMWKFMKNLDSS